jgi:hypothetical protein
MKLASAIFFVCVSLVMAGLPGRADDSDNANNLVSSPGLFSYQPPDGWFVRDSPISKFKVSFEKLRGEFAPCITVAEEHFPGPLTAFAARTKNSFLSSPIFLNSTLVDESSFETSSGLQGMRLVLKDTISKLDLQQIVYVFAGDGDRKFLVTGSCLSGDGDQYASIFDDSIKSFDLASSDSSSSDQ